MLFESGLSQENVQYEICKFGKRILMDQILNVVERVRVGLTRISSQLLVSDSGE